MAKRRKMFKGKQSKDKQQDKRIQKLERLVRPERKVFDLKTESYADNTGWYMLPVSLTAEGTEYNTRIGRKVKAMSIFLRGQFKINPGATATTCRLICFWDKASNNQVPAPSDVMQTNTDLQSPLDYDTAGTRFKILMDRTYDLSISGDRVKSFNLYKKLKQTVTYNGSSNTSGQLTTGQVYVMWLANETADADKRAEINLWSRFTFIDQ